MSPPVHISSLDNPRVKQAIRLWSHRHRRRTGHFIAEGRRQVERALAASLTPLEIYACRTLIADRGQIVTLLETVRQRHPRCRTMTVDPAPFRKLAYRQHPDGLLAVFEQAVWEVPDVTAAVAAGGFCLVAVGLEKPGNLGALARSADAAGASGLIVADGVCDPWNPNAIRASTGAVFSLPVVPAESAPLLEHLRRTGAAILLAAPHAEQRYADADMTGPLAIVVGAEDRGLGPPWLTGDTAAPGTRPVAIPNRGRVVDSLNAAAAGAVLLFECVRQRRL